MRPSTLALVAGSLLTEACAPAPIEQPKIPVVEIADAPPSSRRPALPALAAAPIQSAKPENPDEWPQSKLNYETTVARLEILRKRVELKEKAMQCFESKDVTDCKDLMVAKHAIMYKENEELFEKCASKDIVEELACLDGKLDDSKSYLEYNRQVYRCAVVELACIKGN